MTDTKKTLLELDLLDFFSHKIKFNYKLLLSLLDVNNYNLYIKFKLVHKVICVQYWRIKSDMHYVKYRKSLYFLTYNLTKCYCMRMGYRRLRAVSPKSSHQLPLKSHVLQ